MKKCRTLNEVRKNIDAIDNQIAKLLVKRSSFVLQATYFKTKKSQLIDRKRIARIIKRVSNVAKKQKLSPIIVEKVFRKMINQFILLETKEFNRINKKR
ncbi:MAG: chorismate mutase [Pseudomonadota bacterium]|nr:chorismate mutase [Pseudomonadota bacterium]MEC8875881.1 chorismate mutase [Pseudomonadota bacterium]MED5338854.1 chorismate mutase [Pseudomonadota bacterium]MEE3207201.1 chorismate mutase [Pseudomonadota bacterium]MEE3260933.1 chorismate mutase [Pseudomonadota bacterium]|tara:strand:- start:1036 stop:1332 length:297 start_codon:yes stop_codon:yes gene_type:complete